MAALLGGAVNVLVNPFASLATGGLLGINPLGIGLEAILGPNWQLYAVLIAAGAGAVFLLIMFKR